MFVTFSASPNSLNGFLSTRGPSTPPGIDRAVQSGIHTSMANTGLTLKELANLGEVLSDIPGGTEYMQSFIDVGLREVFRDDDPIFEDLSDDILAAFSLVLQRISDLPETQTNLEKTQRVLVLLNEDLKPQIQAYFDAVKRDR